MTDPTDAGVSPNPVRGHTGPTAPIVDLTALVRAMGASEDELRSTAANMRLWAKTLSGAVLLLRNASRDCERAADAQGALRRTLNGQG